MGKVSFLSGFTIIEGSLMENYHQKRKKKKKVRLTGKHVIPGYTKTGLAGIASRNRHAKCR